MVMMKMRVDVSDVNKVVSNVIEYTRGFLEEISTRRSYISRKVANTSIEAFYQYLDSLARTNPSMLHHVYEWGQVGNPSARLYELQAAISGDNSIISANFLQSTSIKDGSKEPFYDKANVMENGITVVIKEVDAQALFFEIDGVEYFRTGPIVIENPGGPETRGSFVRYFEEFYNVYFTQVYLRSIRFYEHMSNPQPYMSQFSAAARSGAPRSLGKAAAIAWITRAPGDDYE